MANKQDVKTLAAAVTAGIEKDLGAVSAYAIAVEHGYEGTEEEWAAEMQKALSSVDESAASAQAAKESADAAAQSAKDAQSSARGASDSATLAGQHKTDAESAKNSAEQFANTAEREATDAENARDQAEAYMEKAQASSAVSNSSYYIGEDGKLHLKFNSNGLGQNDIDQTLSTLQSDVAELQSGIEALGTELDTVALRQLNYGNAQVGGTSLGITSTKLLEVEVPQTYRGKRVVLELVGLCVQISSGTASIEIKKVNGGQDVNPPAFSVDISSGNPAVISRVTMVQTDSNTEAFRVYGYVSASSASAKIANGNTFCLKVSCMAS